MRKGDNANIVKITEDELFPIFDKVLSKGWEEGGYAGDWLDFLADVRGEVKKLIKKEDPTKKPKICETYVEFLDEIEELIKQHPEDLLEP